MTPLWPGSGPLWPGAGQIGVGGVPAGVKVRVRRRQVTSRPDATRPSLGPWATATEHDVEGVGLDRTSSTVIGNQAGDDTALRSTVWAPTDADIRDGDRITFPTGTIVEVDGIPNREPNMINGWSPPMSVPVRVTYG